ncbi:MAG: response regulator [Planctomycetota bacterium]|jgi:two-component system response regulator
MNNEDVVLIAGHDKKYFELIRKNLLRAGIRNEIVHLADGRQLLDFLFDTAKESGAEHNYNEFILFLDLSTPEVSGLEVLREINQHTNLKKIPVIILTSINDPDVIDQCHYLDCSTYIVKPAEHEDLEETIQTIGRFLSVVQIPSIR